MYTGIIRNRETADQEDKTMKIKERVFKIEDIDCECIVEVVSKQKDILDLIDEYIENLQYDWFDGSDDSFHIIYKDGTETFVDENYDGHKMKRKISYRWYTTMYVHPLCTVDLK